ncbi:IlvD/Edd family dehydratase [Microbulbifer thermotolerans]|uniref:Dihydroxy-acid dehydratase n=1 Tax=Microbulbifer thermotolerans TaxID=252514 RepID=A0A143HP49_MICTH|nr:IlvD/Edd family dehydratase [Microbulbifer thermotolerans]AMX03468.1 dihydroxy-acid dehydratase [Microbulbifer thermotolerans]MCX2780616.1 dihydroxy-acid dehydratase family protein [Microbulbifer thermotolerans]MCX2802457.1 dihydroxy-acid dehydratase family protein [Microbulbifer thermotolerans]MCX2806157.1 dihydroxy-acid dehydratase family protein [Microbulbifer thermotolerans]
MNKKRKLRSADWFNDPNHPDHTAIYIERYLNYGLTREELQSGKPIIGIAQTGSDLTPCNRHHRELAQRVREGIRDAGGIPLEFPVHPIAEMGKRPTAALDRNLAYLGLVEILYGYPLDGVVLTTGCDKTTPATLMAAAAVDIPAIVLSGGPMLNGWETKNNEEQRVGSGTIIWRSREDYARGDIDYEQFMQNVTRSAPSVGHCNTMGTALTMNCLAEGLGMSLPGCAAIPAPYKERPAMAYYTGRRIVDMVWEDLKPSDIMTRAAFLNAVRLCSAIGGSTNAPPHLQAIANRLGVELSIDDWQTFGEKIPLLVNCQPAGEYLGEDFYRAGGVPAVMGELLRAELIDGSCRSVNGRTIGENYARQLPRNTQVIRSFDDPLRENAGFAVMRGNLFDSAIMKKSVIGDDFRKNYLSNPEHPNVLRGRAIVFEGPEDYHRRIDDPALEIDEHCILVIRNCGPVGYPGSAEVVNMRPPNYLIKRGVSCLPCIGDGRQSGTSASPSILNASPEAAVGGGLALLETNDIVEIDLNKNQVHVLVEDGELQRRRARWQPPRLVNQTPWQEIYRNTVTQLADGSDMDLKEAHLHIVECHGTPRNSH